MKKTLSIMSLAILSIQPSIGISDTVFCVNCGTEWTQLVNYAQLAQQTENMIRQLEILQQQAARMSGSMPASQTAALLQSLFSIVHQGEALGYDLAKLEKRFQLQYPDFRNQQGDYFSNYTNWSRSTQDSIKAALRAAGLQADSFATEAATAQTLRAMNTSSGGQMQAIQVGNAISSEMLDEMRKLRQIQISQNQAHDAFLLQQQQESNARKANAEAVVNSFKKDIQSMTIEDMKRSTQ